MGTINRYAAMHLKKFPEFSEEISQVMREVFEGRVVPSMRGMQFGGYAVERSNARLFNCSYAALTSWQDFGDLFWLLLNGVGVGYSVQQQHVSKQPYVWEGLRGTFIVPDTKEGWADAVKYTLDNPQLKLDVSQVRVKGSPLSTGGVASGPETLVEALEKVKAVLRRAVGRHLTPLESFDIMCYLADIVVVGAVRRAATIALFDAEDHAMLTSKTGNWWEDNPQRARANISAVVDRSIPGLEEQMRDVLTKCFDSGSGEPGVFLTNDPDIGINPCAEISLRSRGLCNLTEINVAACRTEGEFLAAVRSAAALGTLQASYTDFEYLHPYWKKNADEEALLGVSLTGQAENWELLSDTLLEQGARIARQTNQEWAARLGINSAARITCVKPSGSTSAWWGTTSGIHAAHAPYFLRRVRVDRKDEFGKHLLATYGVDDAGSGRFLEYDKFNAENIILTMPIAMTSAIFRNVETSVDLLNRTKHIYDHWVKPGHIVGANTHNVSLTVSYRPGEERAISDWMVENRDSWSGIALLPYDGGNYVQAPFEEITHEEYENWLERIPQDVNFAEVDFSGHVDMRAVEMACGVGGSCEIY